MGICVLINEEIMNEKIIFKRDKKMIKDLLEDVFEKVNK